MFFEDSLLFASGGGANYRIPSVVADADGNFYAFCNDRRGTLSDAAPEVSLMFARKRAGEAWETPKILLAVPGWAVSMGSAIYDPLSDEVMCSGEKIPVQRKEFGRYTPEELAEFERKAEELAEKAGIRKGQFIVATKDGGESWQVRPLDLKKREFTASDGRGAMLGGSCHGSSHGIVLRHGPHAGRLICPSRAATDFYHDWEEIKTRSFNNAIYSDDRGRTWHASAPVQPGTGEGTLIENADGSLTYNSRAYFRDGKRYLATSRDGGETWSDFRTDGFLMEETFCGCNASFLRIERGELKDPSLLPPDSDGMVLFANPRSSRRENMAVCVSFDGGKSWPVVKTVFAGPSSYSSVDYAKAVDRFVLLYERGDKDPCDGGVAAAVFDPAWLLA